MKISIIKAVSICSILCLYAYSVALADVKVLRAENQNHYTRLKKVEASLKSRLVASVDAYSEEGAKLWSQVVENSSYSVFPKRELSLLTKFEQEMFSQDPSFSDRILWDWGGGDGKKASYIIEQKHKALAVAGKQNESFEYRDVECSKELAELAEKSVTTLGANVSFKWYSTDFEKNSLREQLRSEEALLKKKSIIYFLGMTIGNFEQPEEILRIIQNTMSEDTLLVVGLDLHQNGKIDELLEIYRNPKLTALNVHLLKELQLNIGVDGDFKVSYEVDEATQRGSILFEFVFSKDTEFKIEVTQGEFRSVEIKAGEKLHIHKSHRFSDQEVKTMFRESGLQIDNFMTDPDGYALIIAKRK